MKDIASTLDHHMGLVAAQMIEWVKSSIIGF